jgi:hypothetical protein
MSDIISEISRISEDELRMQIALIDNVNISNAVKETGYRLVNVLADVANSFTQSIGIKNSIDYEVKKVSDLVREDCLRYKALNREKLEKMLYERLEVMCPEIEGDMKDKEVKEQMSRYIIDEAASAYGINKYMSPAHKIEEISIRYNNAFLNNIMNQIRNLTAVQKKSYAEQVGRKLGVASMETKREVQKSLMPEKFNGEGIIDVLGRQRSTTKLEAAIRLLGEDAFWSTEAQVKTMYQAVRNMTRISKLQAAGYIWKVSHANDIKFYAPSDLMPSYIAADKKKAADDKDREYRVMCTHVAGTNGKGSVCAYIAGILQHNGYKTGLFTSPHLDDITERIRINGIMISQEDFEEAYWYVEEHRTQELAYFDYLFGMAM